MLTIKELQARNASLKKPSEKIARDLARADELLSRADSLTMPELAALLQIVNVAFHDSGKIAGHCSIDGCSHACEFCAAMRVLPGTVCGMCYAWADAGRYAFVALRHSLNQIILSSVLFPADLLTLLPCSTLYVRFNEDGDLRNAIQARNYFRIANVHPANQFALWCKNTAPVAAAVRMEGKPANLTIIYSSPFIDRPIYSGTGRDCPEWIDSEFTVYSDLAGVEKAVAVGAKQCNGRKCAMCEHCYAGAARRASGAPVNAIAELLRKK